MNSIRFKNVPVPKTLQGDIESIRVIEYIGDEDVSIKVLPNGAPGIVFQHMNGQSIIDNITTDSGTTKDIPTLFLYGSGLKPSVMNYKAGSYATIQIILKSHGLNSLLGMNASILANKSVAMNELSIGHLNEQLLDVKDTVQQAHLLTNFLLKRLCQAQTRDRLIESGLQLIHQNIASINVSSLTQALHLSERQFERRFRQTVGISAKSYIRVKRFNEAIRLIQLGQFTNLTQIAHKLCFYDQSHFIHDVKSFSGVTPQQLVQQADNFHDTQKVYSYE